MRPKQLATSKRKPKAAQAKGYVDGSIARSHVSTDLPLSLWKVAPWATAIEGGGAQGRVTPIL